LRLQARDVVIVKITLVETAYAQHSVMHLALAWSADHSWDNAG